jgi:magnesium transporter
MNEISILQEVREHIETVVSQDSSLGVYLWGELIKLHPADIAKFLTDIEEEYFKPLYLRIPRELQLEVFDELSAPSQIEALDAMDDQGRADALNRLPSDELTDLFEYMSDENLKKYLELLTIKAREKVLSLLQFHPDSAGGTMDTEVLTFQGEFTVERSISILQRLRPSRDVYQQIYVTNREHQLMGYIKLEDLVLQRPQNRIASFMRKAEFVAYPDEDREEVARKMVHYGLLSVPVVDDEDHLLGIIQSDTLAEVLLEEASEDVQKMSAVQPLKYPYFETSFFRILYQRGYILLALFIAQSFSTTIMQAYQSTLSYGCGLLLYFTTMLISTGGNASNQTSAVAIQGMITGDINSSNIKRFIRREMLMAIALAIIFGFAAFIRSYMFMKQNAAGVQYLESFAIAMSQAIIVFVSVSIGSCVPAMLKKLKVDPAFAAGPMLATLMDIIGILIYCMVTRYILF